MVVPIAGASYNRTVLKKRLKLIYVHDGGLTIMSLKIKFAGAMGGACVALAVGTGAALAEDKLEFSANIAGTSDYVFRGISQRLEQPALQGGVDATYNIFYIGAWASGIDFVAGSSNPEGSGDAELEVDLYAGITPKLGPVDFDLGVIYYGYPGAKDADGAELDYVEFKVGASAEFIKSLTTGVTYFYSPEYTGETGQTHTIEGSIGYEFQKIGIFTPSLTGLVGATLFDTDNSNDYTYWNAGLALAVDNFTLDFRYWDTDSTGNDFCADKGVCDERFVFTASVSLP